MSSKINVKRQNIFVDMTAMCDVAFLLLTFFILTTKFKPNEPVTVDIPASTAQIPIPEKDILLISVDPTGRVFFGVDDQGTRLSILDKVAQKYNFQVNANQQSQFKILDQFGVPLYQLGQYLDLSPEQKAKYPQPGITAKADSTGGKSNELADLILFARQSNPGLRIAIKADKNSDYEKVNDVIQTLLDGNIHKFNLITTAKSAPE